MKKNVKNKGKRRVAAQCLDIPEGFLARMRNELGEEEAEALKRALESTPSVSIRLNAARCRPDTRRQLEERAAGGVEWCADGLRFEERPDFIVDPLFHAGVYYVQEAGSMYYQKILEEILPTFTGEINLLDMCAAPGGKTTAMLNALHKSGSPYNVLANEYDRKRASILVENLQKWGDPNVITTNADASSIGRLGDTFDIIAVDAPCSGEGMMRREPIARSQWSPELVAECSTLQKRILEELMPALKPGGVMIYSTCTFNREENEQNVDYVSETLGLNLIAGPERFMPHERQCEGLFVAVFKKASEDESQTEMPVASLHQVNEEKTVEIADKIYAVPANLYPLYRQIEKNKLHILSVGTMIAERKGNVEVPSSRSVLGNKASNLPYVDLSLEDALNYLRGQTLILPEEIPTGYVAVGFEGYPLGIVKNIGNRANNLYPQEWRIRHR